MNWRGERERRRRDDLPEHIYRRRHPPPKRPLPEIGYGRKIYELERKVRYYRGCSVPVVPTCPRARTSMDHQSRPAIWYFRRSLANWKLHHSQSTSRSRLPCERTPSTECALHPEEITCDLFIFRSFIQYAEWRDCFFIWTSYGLDQISHTDGSSHAQQSVPYSTLTVRLQHLWVTLLQGPQRGSKVRNN